MDIATRLARLEARAEISELCSAYAIACDTRDMEWLAKLFTPDARVESKNGMMRSEGVAGILEMYRGRFRVLGPSFHWTHDQFVRFDDADPDRARGTVLGHAECWRNEEALLAALRYDDEYRRHDGTWRFARRTLSFFYYAPAMEYAEALGSPFRQRAYGDQRPADFPEGLPTWTTWEQPA